MLRFTKPVLLVATLSALMLVLAACGGGGGGGSQGSSSGGGDGALVVEMGPGFVFNPSTITIKAGQETKIQVVNKDSTVHDFVIEALGVNSGEVAAGESVEITIPAAEPGEYEIICAIPGHAAGGMVGKLVVTE
ncbi:MAG: cupredoxin domain-containing protein [Thermaerobacter sp.]|nr:hypothetical protein [Bacillota bacterium]REJ37918.1 MAG: hypothetical protein DIU84_02695 [Bacillota bacterium]